MHSHPGPCWWGPKRLSPRNPVILSEAIGAQGCAERNWGPPGNLPPTMIFWARPLEDGSLVIGMMEKENWRG